MVDSAIVCSLNDLSSYLSVVFKKNTMANKEIQRHKDNELLKWCKDLIFLRSDYRCKHLVISMTKLNFEEFQHQKLTTWKTIFFWPQQQVVKAITAISMLLIAMTETIETVHRDKVLLRLALVERGHKFMSLIYHCQGGHLVAVQYKEDT